LAKASRDEAKAKLTLTKNGTTQNDIDAATAALHQAEASAAALEAGRADLELVAPFSGVVTETSGKVGEVVTNSTTVVSLMPDSRLVVKANISEGSIVGVKEGQKVSMDLDAFPRNQRFFGTISEIDPAETIIGGAVYYHGTVLFDQDYPDVRPGMTANLKIEIASSSDTLMVPASALSSSATTTNITVLSGKLTKSQAVSTGMKSQDGMVEILSGLSEGQVVVLGAN
jgi:RND family efflux transporter MFP subunit